MDRIWCETNRSALEESADRCRKEAIRLRSMPPDSKVIPTVPCPGWTLAWYPTSVTELADAYDSGSAYATELARTIQDK